MLKQFLQSIAFIQAIDGLCCLEGEWWLAGRVKRCAQVSGTDRFQAIRLYGQLFSGLWMNALILAGPPITIRFHIHR